AICRTLGSAAAVRQRQLSGGLAAVLTPVRRNDAPAPVSTPTNPSARLDWQEPAGDPLPPELDHPPPGPRSPPVYRMDEPIVAQRIEPGWIAGEAGQPFAVRSLQSAGPKAAGAAIEEIGEVAPQVTAIQQVANSYLALLTPDAVYLVDQHA